MPITAIGGIQMDYDKQMILSPVEKSLTTREIQLVKILLENIGNRLEKRDITKQLWGSVTFFNRRAFDVYLNRFKRYTYPVLVVNLEEEAFTINYSE